MTRVSITTRAKLVLLAAALGLGIAAPYLFSQFIVGLLSLGLITGLFAMSIDLLAGYAGLTTLGHAGVSATAAYGVGYMASKVGAGLPVQIATGFAVGMLASVLFGVMAMRASGVYFMMITLAQGMIVWGLSIRLHNITGAENGLTGIERPEFLRLYWQYYWFVLFVVALCGLALYVVVRSPFGMAAKGLRESESRLSMLGYSTSLQKLYVFVVSGFFATISGILLVYLNEFISPASVHISASAIPLLAAILGGLGTLIGPVIGSMIIVFIQNVVSQYVERWPTLLGVSFVVVVLFARRGLVGAVSDLWHSWLERRAGQPLEPAPAGEQRSEMSVAASKGSSAASGDHGTARGELEL